MSENKTTLFGWNDKPLFCPFCGRQTWPVTKEGGCAHVLAVVQHGAILHASDAFKQLAERECSLDEAFDAGADGLHAGNVPVTPEATVDAVRDTLAYHRVRLTEFELDCGSNAARVLFVVDDLSGETVTPPELADLAYDLKYELSDDDVNVLPMTDERYHEFQKVKAQILEALWDFEDDVEAVCVTVAKLETVCQQYEFEYRAPKRVKAFLDKLGR